MVDVEKGDIVGRTDSEGTWVVTDIEPYVSHGRTYIRTARMAETEIDRGFSTQKVRVRLEGLEDISRLMKPLPGFEEILAGGPDVQPILEKLYSEDIQPSKPVHSCESADQPPSARLIDASGGILSSMYDLDAFEKHVKEVLTALQAYAGDDPKKIEEFTEAYHRGIILKPK